LVALSHHLTSYALATLGEGHPCIGHYQGLPQPIWCAQDNDMARRSGESRYFPGEEQARLFLRFFAEAQMQAFRLRPWKQWKGFDEWICHATRSPVVQTMRQKLAAQEKYGMLAS